MKIQLHVKHPLLNDAQAIARRFPNDFSVPSDEELRSLVPGVCVKVGIDESGMGGEGFWVELVWVDLKFMVGKIVNHLQRTAIHKLSAGDEIMVYRENICEIYE